MKVGRVFAACLVLSLVLGACSRTPEPTRSDPSASSAATLAANAPKAIQILPAPAGDVATVVRDARAKAKSEGRTVIVYVGATWCEPCRRFHDAAKAGELDARFPSLSLLEFDLDQDRKRLDTAGYTSEYVPLFTVPGDDGRATSKHIEGASTKGAGAVADIASRLKALL